MLKVFGAALLAVLLFACAGGGEYSEGRGKTLLVSREVWDAYKDYSTKISGVNKGIFVVGVNGGTALTASYVYCPGTSCMADNYGKRAFDSCRGFGADLECIKFATSGDILVNYKVVDE
jgi:hypothetical protein